MVRVKVRYFGKLRELLGVREEDYEIEESTLADLLLRHIPNRHRGKAEDWKRTIFMTIRDGVAVRRDGTPVLKNYIILVRGRNLNLSYRLKDNDEVAILPPVGGGKRL